MAPSPLLRYAAAGAVVARVPQRPDRMHVPAYRGLAVWLVEIDRQGAIMRSRRPLYDRFDRTARTLTPQRLRMEEDAAALEAVLGRLKAARHPGGHVLHGLNRVWSRAELGVLITEATNRARQLAIGRVLPRPKGPRLDPRRLPEDRLAHLIQHHRDLDLVEMLRAELRRRRHLEARHAP